MSPVSYFLPSSLSGYKVTYFLKNHGWISYLDMTKYAFLNSKAKRENTTLFLNIKWISLSNAQGSEEQIKHI